MRARERIIRLSTFDRCMKSLCEFNRDDVRCTFAVAVVITRGTLNIRTSEHHYSHLFNNNHNSNNNIVVETIHWLFFVRKSNPNHLFTLCLSICISMSVSHLSFSHSYAHCFYLYRLYTQFSIA